MRSLVPVVVFAVLLGCASVQPISESERSFDAVYEAPGFTEEQIFSGTRIWIAESFVSAKEVIEYENQEVGSIIGNGIIPYPCRGMDCAAKGDWSVPFTMRVDVKDERFRLTFSNLRLTWPPSYSATYGSQPGNNVPLSLRGDYESVKPVLLGFGDSIVKSLAADRARDDW